MSEYLSSAEFFPNFNIRDLFYAIQCMATKEEDELGGNDKDDWKKEAKDHYSNKGGHKERSDANKEKRKEEQKQK